MTLSDKDIEKFQELYKSHFGIEISKEQAHEEGMKLIRLIILICRPAEKNLL